MNQSELESLSNIRLAPDKRARLSMLLSEQKQCPLTEQQNEEIDSLLAEIDRLTILKAEARCTLAKNKKKLLKK